MKNNLFFILLILLFNSGFSQKLFNNNILDTLSIEEFGKKIELENDIKKSERLNNLLIDEVLRRKENKKVPKKIRLYYENAYLALLINKAYYDGSRGDYKKEIAVYFQILKNKNSSTNDNILAYVYNAIGVSFSEIKDYEKSIFYCKRAIVYFKKVNNNTGIIAAYDNIGDFYTRLKQLDTAMFYLQKAEFYG